MAERIPSSDGAYGRVAYVAERLAWPIGFTNLTSGAHNFAEVTHFQALSKFVRSTRQVFARCCLGWSRDASRLATGTALVAGSLPGWCRRLRITGREHGTG